MCIGESQKKNDSDEEDKYKHNFKGHIRLTNPSSIQYIDSIEVLRGNNDIPKNIIYPSDFDANGELDFTAYAKDNRIKLYYYLKDGKYFVNTKVFYPTYDEVWWDVTGGLSPTISNITEEGPYLIDVTIKPINTVNLSLIKINGELNDSFFANLDHIEIQNYYIDNPIIRITPNDFIFDDNPNDDENTDSYVETSVDTTGDIIIKVVPKQADANVSNITVYYNGNKIKHTRTANTFTIPYKGNDDYYLVYFNGINVPTPPEPITKTVNIWQAVEGEDLTVSVDKIEVSIDNNNAFTEYDKFSYPYDRMYNLTMRSKHNEGDYEWVGWYKNNEVITNATSVNNLSFISSDVIITRESISDEPIITNYISIIRRKPVELTTKLSFYKVVEGTDFTIPFGKVKYTIDGTNNYIETTKYETIVKDYLYFNTNNVNDEGYENLGSYISRTPITSDTTINDLKKVNDKPWGTYGITEYMEIYNILIIVRKKPEPEPEPFTSIGIRWAARDANHTLSISFITSVYSHTIATNKDDRYNQFRTQYIDYKDGDITLKVTDSWHGNDREGFYRPEIDILQYLNADRKYIDFAPKNVSYQNGITTVVFTPIENVTEYGFAFNSVRYS